MLAGFLKKGVLLLLAIAVAVGPLSTAVQAGQMAFAMQAAGEMHDDPAEPCAASAFECLDDCAEMGHSDCAISCAANCTMTAAADLPFLNDPVFHARSKAVFDLPSTGVSGCVAIEPNPPRESITL